VIREHGLTPEEFEKIKQLLGEREPTRTELGIFSVMWSEHCSYKSSRVHLKRLPTRSKLVLQGPGENAGIVDIGDGWACAFKIESHNHPSFIEPFQERPRASAEFCGTFSPWEPGRLRLWTRCALVRFRVAKTRARAPAPHKRRFTRTTPSWKVWSLGSLLMGIVSACPTWAAR